MNPANIRRSEAQQRSASLSTESYQVLIDLTGHDAQGQPLPDPEQTFLSTSTARFRSDGQPTWIDLIADRLVSASLDGDPLSPGLYGDNRLMFAPEPGEHELTVTAVCRYSHTGEGLHRFVDPADGAVYLYSQFESADARRMYACFEQPDLKATFTLSVIAPAGWTVVSNSPTPQPEDAGDGRQRWDFTPTTPIATYITALVAGEYAVHQGTVLSAKGELPANLICRKSMQPYLDAGRIMLTTRRGFEVYEAAFGRPYPFDKYDQVFVPEYNAGAMENAGCVTIRDEYLYRSKVTQASYETRDNTILHELAHMWFGDLVTMRWWDDLWLNESFAEWASHYSQNEIAASYGGVDPWTAFANQRKVWAYRQDQLPTTHPVAADMVDLEAVEQNFDGITYAKGASVLKQLVAYVGQDQFLAGVRAYLDAHAFGNASLADLLGALEEASGRDLSDFTRQWLTTSGLNTIRADVAVDDEGRYTRVELVQSAPADFPVLRTHRLALGLFNLTETGLTRIDSLELDMAGESTPVPRLVGQPQPDLLLVNDADLTYAKVRLDERSLATLTGHLDQLTDSLARAVAWTALYDMARDAELAAGDYADLVLSGIATERDSTAITTQLAQARQLAISFTAPEDRPGERTRLVAGLARLLKDATPGSDLQLAVADNLILAVDSPAGIDMLKGWLEGFDVPFGLPIEADRRWAILTSMARLGAIGEQEIAAETRRDPTITGAESAAGARSALADPDAKRTAWHLATADPDVPNGTHLATCRQFWQYGQEELLASYRDRYLELCTDIAERRGIWHNRGHAASQAALSWLFPTPLADQGFLDKLDAWVAQHRPSPTVGRVLAEQRDNAARAIRGQQLTADQV